MRKLDQYLSTIDTLYSDGYTRERIFRDDGDMVDAELFHAPPRNLIERLLGRLGVWHRKRASRLVLRELSDEQLCDIGITRHDAANELAKARLLQLPSRWF